VLRSVRQLQQYRVRTSDGHRCGRIKDVYFDDSVWKVDWLVLSIEPSASGRKEVLLKPCEVVGIADEVGVIRLGISAEDLEQLPLANSVLPVCKQYESFAYASLGGRKPVTQTNPHLRSTKAVVQYQVDVAGEFSGRLADLVYEIDGWEIRYLRIEQAFDEKLMNFHVLPQSVERIVWATQRVLLRELNPVVVDPDEWQAGISVGAAA
jgi:sporulation protein YlmC with PRC-barrel domain